VLDPTHLRDAAVDRLADLRDDERAIEGLPVRLVVSLVGGLAASELDVRPTPEVVEPGAQELTLQVVDAEGDPVSGATVVVKGGTASLDGVTTARTGPDGNATVSIHPRLGGNRAEGTITLDVKPPAGKSFVDRRENSHVLVVER
jgi:hypothetical protein